MTTPGAGGWVVADASPLIALHQLGRLDLLHQLYGDVRVPPAVEREAFTARGRARPTWIVVQAPTSVPPAKGPETPPGAGEAEAIALALEIPGARVLLDDRVARRAALAAGLRIVGTVAVLVRARREGLLPSLREALDRLRADRFRLSRRLYLAALRAVGEGP